MRKNQRTLSALLTAVALATSTLLASCGGGGGASATDTTITVPADAAIVYKQGDLSATDPLLQKTTASLASTSGALFQAIFAVNSFVFTDPKVTNYATYVQRQADANQALNILIAYASTTEQNADALPSSATGLQSAQAMPTMFRAAAVAAASPDEVLAVLNSSKSKWPIKTLMQQYQVSAKRAQLILNNAMAGISNQAYLEEAMLNTQTITRLALIRDASALTVAVGGTIVTMGAAAAATGTLTGLEVGTAAIATADAAIKVTKSGAELAIGQDGALDSAFERSIVLRTISDANELLSIKGLFPKSGNWLDATNKLTWVGGKVSDFFQDNVISFGAESVNLKKMDADFKANLFTRINAAKYPTTFPGNYIDAAKAQITVSPTDIPQVVLDAMDTLPVADQLAIVKQMLPDTPDVPDVPGQAMAFDGTYIGSADLIGAYSIHNPNCWSSDNFRVTVLGSVLGGDLVGTVSGSKISGKLSSKEVKFNGELFADINMLSGTYWEPDTNCTGTFSLNRK